MTAKILDGAELAKQVMGELKPRIAALAARGIVPGLTVIILGEDPASMSYVRGKGKACEGLEMRSETCMLPAGTSQEQLLGLIAKLNTNPRIHGILVQLPLPAHVNEDAVLEAISPEKDVDGFSPINMGRLMAGRDCFKPCTPNGIMELMARNGIDPSGKHAVIIGRSNIVGKPMAAMLMQKAKGANATVTVCHSGTRKLESITKRADILIAAMGKPGFVKAGMVKKDAVVIDVGINRVEDKSAEKGYRLVGDVDFEAVKDVAGAITPVPGGVGKTTIAMLMLNTVAAAEKMGGQAPAP
jgi:methylenetetrahydrofolate dehydrogenase (NADP+)/methenyltetrahydrofolate cyclohydrolase